MKWYWTMCIMFFLGFIILPMVAMGAVKVTEPESDKALTVGANLDARVNYVPGDEVGSFYYGDSSLKFTFNPTDGFNTIYWELRPDSEQGIKIKRAYIDTDLAKAMKLEGVSLSHRIGRQTVEAYDYSFTDSGFELFEPSYTQNAAMATFGYGGFGTRLAYLAYPDGILMTEFSFGLDKYLYHVEVGYWHQSHVDEQIVASISAGAYGFTVGGGMLASRNADTAYGGAIKYDYKDAYLAAAANSLKQWDFNAGYAYKGKTGFDVSVYNDGTDTSVKPWIWVKAGKAKYRLVYDTVPKKITWRVNMDF